MFKTPLHQLPSSCSSLNILPVDLSVSPCWKGFPRGSVANNPPANAGDAGSIPGSEMATHSNFLLWEIPWTEEPGGLSYGVAKSGMT